MKLRINGGGVQGRSVTVDCQQRVNFFFDPAPRSGRTDGAYVGTPGLSQFVDLSGSTIRGLHPYNGKLYAVKDNTLYEITTAGVATSKGTLSTSTGRVSMDDNGPANGHQLMIVDGSHGYIFDSTAGTLTAISDPDFPGGDYVWFNDSYFIVNKPSTGEWFKSSGYDGTTWAALDFATAEYSPDQLLAVLPDHSTIHLFGEKTTEIWWDRGSAGFPYERVGGGVIEHGLAAQYAVAKIDNGIAWLSRDSRGQGQLVLARGGTEPQVISPPEFTYAISQYSDISDAFCYSFQYEGSEFLVITFPTGNDTWVWSAVTHQMHNWRTGTGRHLSNCYAFFNGKHYVGDYNSGKIYQIDSGTYTDGATAITRDLVFPHIEDDRKRIRIREIEINFEPGGSAAPQLKWSKDGGNTFGSYTASSTGTSYTTRCIWRRLGQARDWVFHLHTTDAKKYVVIDARLEVR